MEAISSPADLQRAASASTQAGLRPRARLVRRSGLLLLGMGLLALAAYLWAGVDFGTFPESWNLGLRQPIDQFESWVIGNRTTHPFFALFVDPVKAGLDLLIRAIENVLLQIPWTILLLALFVIAWRGAGIVVALFSVICLLITGMFGLWQPTMQTLALMGVAVLLSLLIGVPLGIWSARSDRVDAALRPVLDAMQTMPAFVYLIPVVLLLGVARAPAVVATIIYALPPAVRLTNLGIRQVSPNSVEAADMFGSTAWQKLVKVQLPLALPSILLGVNQTIMMALGIVVIAALVGAGGLGGEVMDALRQLRVGQGLEAGLAIVFLAVIFDRISFGFSRNSRAAKSVRIASASHQDGMPLRKLLLWGGLALVALILWLGAWLNLQVNGITLARFPAALHFSIREPVDAAVIWMQDNLYQIGNWPIGTGPLSDFLIIYLLNPLRSLFQTWLPWPLIILSFAWLGYAVKGGPLALAAAICLFCTGLLGMWPQTMDTLSQVLVAVLIAVVLGIPLGIVAARSDWAEFILRPILDFLQTIPQFVYLVPVIMLFNVGRVPGVIASVLYAIPPVIRLTNLGIRQVSPNTLEAADMFGSTAWQKLVKVQLPLALPSIMAGVNQTVMMVLAMVIIAGLVGGGALGYEAVTGLAKSQLGRGIESGLAIVLLAVGLDRITQAWGRLGD
ncbi:MAG: ABC transporter permease subunit [Caldilineaceae bacterium]